jgi:hypothetical protein
MLPPGAQHLPVPVSPVIKTVAFVGATASTSERVERRPPRRPTIVSTKEVCARLARAELLHLEDNASSGG